MMTRLTANLEVERHPAELFSLVQDMCSQEGGWRLLKHTVLDDILQASRELAGHSSDQSDNVCERVDKIQPNSVANNLLAQVLPLISNVLPRDKTGAAIRPHPHALVQKESDRILGVNFRGERIYVTNKVCDQCNTQIHTRTFYSCSTGCDFDICVQCNSELEVLLKESDEEQIGWVAEVTGHIADIVWSLPLSERDGLINRLARDWPLNMFEQLVVAIVDVANSKALHLEDSSNIQGDEGFWHIMALLQVVYAANTLDAEEQRLDESGVRGPRVELDSFILQAIDKCAHYSEYRRWQQHPEIDAKGLMLVDQLNLTPEFCSFLTHAQFVPISFRRKCLLLDAFRGSQAGVRGEHLTVTVRRSATELREDVLSALGDVDAATISRPFKPTFAGEPASGPGVVTEFFQLAVQAFLEDSTWVFDEQHRCYWFAEGEETASSVASFRACGVVLGQAVLYGRLIPRVFPSCLYNMLLHELGSPHHKTFTLVDLATVSPELARSLEAMLQYSEDDIDDKFGSLDWPQRPDGPLTHDNKISFATLYTESFFKERFARQFDAFASGFFGVIGRSEFLRRHFDSPQMEAIICGGCIPVDITALQKSSIEVGWDEEDRQFLAQFWSSVEGLDEADRRRFLIFVTASDRMPLEGWGTIKITVQKNGSGDLRLPTALTCFRTLLLPLYTSVDRLHGGLKEAINNSQGFGLR